VDTLDAHAHSRASSVRLRRQRCSTGFPRSTHAYRAQASRPNVTVGWLLAGWPPLASVVTGPAAVVWRAFAAAALLWVPLPAGVTTTRVVAVVDVFDLWDGRTLVWVLVSTRVEHRWPIGTDPVFPGHRVEVPATRKVYATAIAATSSSAACRLTPTDAVPAFAASRVSAFGPVSVAARRAVRDRSVVCVANLRWSDSSVSADSSRLERLIDSLSELLGLLWAWVCGDELALLCPTRPERSHVRVWTHPPRTTIHESSALQFVEPEDELERHAHLFGYLVDSLEGPERLFRRR